MVRATVTAKMGDLGGKFFGKVPDPALVRHYYIAAEPELWDYAPQGRDVICGQPFPPNLEAERKTMKARYVQYADDSFQMKVRGNPSLGILGPLLRGKVGEYLAVTFLNRTHRPLSMHPHGVKYDKDSEGSLYFPQPGKGGAVGNDAKFTYVWHLDEASGPLPSEPSSKAWLYHSHVTGDDEIQSGLMGCIVVTDPKRARPDGSPNDVDREFAALYLIFNDSNILPEEYDAPNYTVPKPPGPPGVDWARDQETLERGSRYGINGMVYGNLPGLEMNEGERVRWYVFGLGSEQDFHTAHWHGQRVIEEGRRRTDVVELLPASMKVADMVADNPGNWLMHCHVAEHMRNGMFARITVHPRDNPRAPHAAFPGLGESVQPLQITDATVEFGPAAEDRQLRLHGSVTVLSPFAVPDTSIEFNVGGSHFAFHLDHNGAAATNGSSMQVKSADRTGTVRNGLMEFDAVLSGKMLSQELRGMRTAQATEEPATLPLAMSVDSAPYTANAYIRSRHERTEFTRAQK